VIEPLDRRCLFDATLHGKTGVLDVEGTDASDTITVQQTVDTDTGVFHLEAIVNNSVQSFRASDVKFIKVNGGNGSDIIDVHTLTLRTTLDGGKGNDTLIGGGGSDKLIGGGGSNTLNGNGGNDLLVAGLQADSIFGGDGEDRIIPDNTPTADDTISGGAAFDVVDYRESKIAVIALVGESPKGKQANDVILSDIEQVRGSAFNDTITDETSHPLQMFGSDGNDTLTGGSGNDTLVGDSGRDSMLGMGGKDSFRSKDGEVDTLDGGGKVDVIQDRDVNIVFDVVSNIP
jgi:Ca2+-binding RTX toxin-like protein